MKDEGFNVKVRFDALPGFLYGGNELNCGTWMDKMGSSEAAGNRGTPATPRDGAPIEITGLFYGVVSYLAQLAETGVFPYKQFTLSDGLPMLYSRMVSGVL